jgi:hypothetical protein
VREEVKNMRLPEYAPPMSDRVSTREELFEVLELLGGFEEVQGTEAAQTCDLLGGLEADPTVSPVEFLGDESITDEQFVVEMEHFNSLLGRKAERIN